MGYDRFRRLEMVCCDVCDAAEGSSLVADDPSGHEDRGDLSVEDHSASEGRLRLRFRPEFQRMVPPLSEGLSGNESAAALRRDPQTRRFWNDLHRQPERREGHRRICSEGICRGRGI